MAVAKLKALLIKHTPDADDVVAQAAKLCYSPVTIAAVRGKMEPDLQEELIRRLILFGHMTPFEHVSFTFAVEGISRDCAHQLMRYRVASYSEQSHRLVSEAANLHLHYTMPPAINQNKDLKNLYTELMGHIEHVYSEIIRQLKDSGTSDGDALADAAMVLPNACESRLMVTMNARELLHFFHDKCCNASPWEIHALADEMLWLARKYAPVIFSTAGPGCVVGPCNHGDLTCGRIKEVRGKYKIVQ